MTAPHFDDATLMAFADGELSGTLAADVAAAAAADPQLAARIEAFRKTRQLAKDAFAADLAAPVPDALRSKIDAAIKAQGGRALHHQTAVPPRTLRRQFDWMMPLAASVAAVAGAFAGYWIAMQSPQLPPSQLALGQLSDQQLAGALSTVPSGPEATQLGPAQLTIVSSFKDPAGAICREFELRPANAAGALAIACRNANAWTITFAQSIGNSQGGYAPADAAPVIDAYLQAINAGPPLSAAEEKALLGIGE